MSLLQEQMKFTHHVALLFAKAWQLGLEFSIGEVLRTPEQQQIYLETGRSKTSNSMHLKKLAIDLNLFKDGSSCTVDEIRPLGKYWESLDALNRWGGSWRGLIESHQSSFVDSPHFERKV